MNSKKGVLHLINNHPRDHTVFDMAREIAEVDGIKVGSVVINDEVFIEENAQSIGRRGIAGNIFVIKACGAAAEQGASLEELVSLGNRVNSAVRTIGMALTSCIPPTKGTPIFYIAYDEMDIGIGIDGEPGQHRVRMASADTIVDEMFEATAFDLPFKKGDRVGLMVNGMGGTPISELYLLYRRAAFNCKDRGLTVVRNYIGNYCTCLEMAGFSLTLIRLNDELEHLLDAPAEPAIRVF
jgi:dihydroxyacetone kinase-like protein